MIALMKNAKPEADAVTAVPPMSTPLPSNRSNQELLQFPAQASHASGLLPTLGSTVISAISWLRLCAYTLSFGTPLIV